ncbi:MAG: tripartite tricarboxylate transporter TctB family protein [Pseudomonadota bacterium]
MGKFFNKDRVGGLLLLAFCVTYALLSQDIRLLPIQARAAFNARTMPEVFAVLGVALSLLVIVFPSSREPISIRHFALGKCALFLILMSAYGFTVRPLGFLLSTSLFLMIGFAMLGERNVLKLVAVAVPIVVLFWLLMTQGLDVFIEPLPAVLRE